MYVYKPSLSEQLSIGTFVKIRPIQDIDVNFGVGFTEEMEDFCGEVFKIEEVYQDLEGYLDENGVTQRHGYCLIHATDGRYYHYFKSFPSPMRHYVFQNHMLVVVSEEEAGFDFYTRYQERVREITKNLNKI